MAQALPHPIIYSAGQQVHYLPQYYSTPYTPFVPSPYPERSAKPERRRPKYTRSKNGCMTCRKKKVKCDEVKPFCQRCSNSQLDCSWPPPPKRKTPVRKRTSPADMDSTTTSDTGTSSLSPTATGDMEGTPQPSLVSEAPSSEDGQSLGAPQMSFHDPNMLHVVAGDRRHSEPHLQMPLAASARRHSMADTSDQHYAPPPSSSNGGALGLTLHQMTSAQSCTRASTPNDFLYAQHTPSGYAGYSPSGSMSMLSGGGSAGTSSASRPSTASSLSLSHSLRRTSAGSRPSTAGSLPGVVSPFSFQMHGRGDMPLDGTMGAATLSAYAPVSRPSTANSAASSSPFMRHMGVPDQGVERWQPSPLLAQSPLVHPHGGGVGDGYFSNLMHSPPHLSRTQSPTWTC